MKFLPTIKISDYNYNLPQHRIAQFPLSERDKSKLLIYKNHQISEDIFKNISGYLPHSGLLIYNETKVIQARLNFTKESGAAIEIFCLEPVAPTRETQLAFQQKEQVVWKCLVGNSKKWKSGSLIKELIYKGEVVRLTANRVEQLRDHSLIEFRWKPQNLTFSEILTEAGIIPLPPYMKRRSEDSDKIRYQTVYANAEGSVAAPTAGLHFTNDVIQSLKRKQITIEEVTLHIGAGTFKPVSTDEISDHEMHTEKIVVNRSVIQQVLDKLDEKIIVVGTTTTRTLESLYWHGVKLIVDGSRQEYLDIQQWDPYDPKYNKGISVEDSFERILQLMDQKKISEIHGQTRLMIVPGYQYRIPDIMITNFHMPKSTLLLLVSAFIGDGWKDAYNYAMNNDFRFLSYGDSCLFFKQ